MVPMCTPTSRRPERRSRTGGSRWDRTGALTKGCSSSYDALMSPLHLGHPEIVYRTAYATPAHRRPGLEGAPVSAPLRVRLVHKADHRLVRTRTGLLQKDGAVKFVAQDLASDVVDLLSSGAKLVSWTEEGEPDRPARPVGPGDVGVLVRTNRQASVVQASLRAAGIPVVVAGALSVMSTPAARDWLTLLEALEQPTARSLAVAAALTPFIGMTALPAGRSPRTDVGGAPRPAPPMGPPVAPERDSHPLRPHPGQRTFAQPAARSS